MQEKFKNATSNWERKLLAIIEDERRSISFGSISVELKITNGKVVLVELRGTTKTYKMD